jgi:hypothetical protein
MKARLFLAAICLIAFAQLAGCTPEKAEALLTAIKAFELHASQALSAYENLFKEYAAVRKESRDELFDQAYGAATTLPAAEMTFDRFIKNVGQLGADRIETRIEKEFQELKASYALLSGAYQSLPRGSLLGARYVSCGRMAVAKLTQQLVNFSVDVDANPLYPIALRQEFAEFKALAKQGAAQKEKAKQKFDSLCAGIAAYEEKHKAAIALTLAAVEQGKKLNELMARYDSMSVTEILGVVEYGLSFAGTLKGIDISQVSASLKTAKAEIEADAYFQRVASIPLVSVAQCKDGDK